MEYTLKIENGINGVNQLQLPDEVFNDYKDKNIAIYHNSIQISGQLKNEGYLIFNGSNSYIQLPESNIFDIKNYTKPFTISFKIYLNNSKKHIIFSIGTLDYQSFNFAIDYDGSIWIISSTNGSSWDIFYKTTQKCLLNTEIDISLTRNNLGLYKMYIDGIEAGYFNNIQNILLDLNSTKIGAHYSFRSDWYFSGNIYNFKLWDIDKTSQQLQEDINKSFIGNELNLLSYYPMNENQGNIIYDMVGNNNGTIYNSQWSQTNEKTNTLIFNAPLNSTDYIYIKEGNNINLDTYSSINIVNLLEYDNLVKINSINYNIVD